MMKHMDISGFLPPRARFLLHFGWEGGETAEHFRRIQPDVRYVAVTEEPGKVARSSSVDVVFQGGVGSLDLSSPQWKGLDCILYEGRAAGALTAEILRRHRECLAPGGQMVFFLENPCSFANLRALFSGKGRVSYGPSPEDLRRLLEEAGLFPVSGTPIYSKEDEAERQRPETGELLSAIAAWQKGRGLPPGDVWARGWLLRAAGEKPREGILVRSLLGEALVTARIRLREPHAFLMTEPGLRYREERGSLDLALGREAKRKILIRQRLHFSTREDALRDIRAAREAGYLLLHEMDDNPFRWQGSYEETEWLDFRGSHACQVSTEALADRIRPYNPHVKVFRNELRELPLARSYEEKPFVSLFFGALNREEDWQEIMPILNEAAKRYGEKLRFRVLADKEFFAALRTAHKEFIGDSGYYNGKYVPYEVYAKTLHGADISLLPLHDTEFNRTKSDLKFIESAGHGAAVLASPTVYEGTVRDGFTGFLYRSPREFSERLRLLVENSSLRLDMARAAYAYVKSERLLSQHYEERLAWYEELFARREELDRELGARLVSISSGSKAGKGGAP